jgi:hypothetical protein
MTLEAAIEHIKTEALPKEANEDSKKTWTEILKWLEELQWHRNGKPEPTELVEMRKRLIKLLDVTSFHVTKPLFRDGSYWIDVAGDRRTACIELCQKEQELLWGISKTTGFGGETDDPGHGYGMGPDHIFKTIDEVIALLESWKLSG